jgi:hypothetical protein
VDATTTNDMDEAPDVSAPPTIPHYEHAPVTRRTLEWRGRLWEVTYHATHDGVGFLVERVECRPMEPRDRHLEEGTIVHVRLKVKLDAGKQVKLHADDREGGGTFWLARGRIVLVEGG